MIDYKPNLVDELKTLGLPVHYELFMTKEEELPCIAYFEQSNISDKEGDTLRYSDITFTIRVYAKTVKEIAQYSIEVDDLMRDLGFVRINTNQIWLDNIGQFIMTYRGKGQEIYGG
jgi:hypothetical protein